MYVLYTFDFPAPDEESQGHAVKLVLVRPCIGIIASSAGGAQAGVLFGAAHAWERCELRAVGERRWQMDRTKEVGTYM